MNLGFNQNENQDDRKRTEVWNVQMRGGGGSMKVLKKVKHLGQMRWKI